MARGIVVRSGSCCGKHVFSTILVAGALKSDKQVGVQFLRMGVYPSYNAKNNPVTVLQI